MNVSILICSHGDDKWRDLAWSRAYPSAAAESAAAAGDSFVEVIIEHERDATLAEMRNQAARHSSGDWLCFLDADDELAAGYLEAMSGKWLLLLHGDGDDHPGFAVLGTAKPHVPPRLLLAPAVQYVEGGRCIGEPAIPNAGRWPDLNECVIGTLVPRRLFLNVGGFRELPSLEDWDLWLRCVRAGASIVHVPDAVYRAHVNPDGGRNSDQSVYHELRREHAEVWS